MKNTNSILDPYWVTGFTDAEGCFSVRFTKNKLHKIGWYISPVFIINLHIRDKNILKDIKSFFDCGTLYYYKNKQVISYAVLDINNINKIIIPHFERYPLITQKLGDYVLWKNIIELMNEKIHLNKEGLKKIVNLKASLNRGLTKKLEICFPDTIKVKKPITSLSKNMDYNWFAGFFTGDGCFFIDILKSKSNKTGYTVTLRIIIGQHSKDEFLINSLINTFKCGYVYKNPTTNYVIFIVAKFKDLYHNIIPFFNQHKIEGLKLLDFKDFCKAAELINKKAHLTKEGLEQIKEIKLKMNKGRY